MSKLCVIKILLRISSVEQHVYRKPNRYEGKVWNLLLHYYLLVHPFDEVVRSPFNTVRPFHRCTNRICIARPSFSCSQQTSLSLYPEDSRDEENIARIKTRYVSFSTHPVQERLTGHPFTKSSCKGGLNSLELMTAQSKTTDKSINILAPSTQHPSR